MKKTNKKLVLVMIKKKGIVTIKADQKWWEESREHRNK